MIDPNKTEELIIMHIEKMKEFKKDYLNGLQELNGFDGDILFLRGWCVTLTLGFLWLAFK